MFNIQKYLLYCSNSINTFVVTFNVGSKLIIERGAWQILAFFCFVLGKKTLKIMISRIWYR